MTTERFPFFLRISPQSKVKDNNSHPYLTNTIYSSLSFPEENDYQIISCIYPCDTILLSPSTSIKGEILNKQFISKDDIYQYHLDHWTDTKPFQFSFVFNELISNKFVYRKISEQNQAHSNQNIIIFGDNKTTFVSKMLIEIFEQTKDVMLTFYSFDYIKKEKKLIKETMQNIPIKCANDIPLALKHMKTKYQLSKNIQEGDNEGNKVCSNRESLIISATNRKMTLNFITMINEDDNLNDAQTLLKSGYDYLTAFILNITDHSSESAEEIRKFHYLYSNQNTLIKLPLVQLLSTNKELSNIIDTCPNLQNPKYSNRILSPITVKLFKEQQSEDLKDSLLFEDKVIRENTLKDSSHMTNVPSSNDIDYQELTNSNFGETESKFTKTVELNKQEISSILIELNNLKKKNILMQNDLKSKDEQIKQLITDKSALEKENKELKDKYNNLTIAYDTNQLNFTNLNRKQELNFNDIELKISKFEAELLIFHKENSNLIKINKKQSIEISTLTKDKEQLYSKYKSSKIQIEQLENKLNKIETEFNKISTHYAKELQMRFSTDGDDNVNDNNKIKNKLQRDYLIENLCNKITKYDSIK